MQAVEKSGSLSHSFRSHSAPRSTALSIAMFGEVVEMADSLISNLINFKFGVLVSSSTIDKIYEIYTFYENRYKIYTFYENRYKIFVKNANFVCIFIKSVNLVSIIVKSVNFVNFVNGR